MKVINKKAILGFAMSMIFSLAFMQGLSTKSNGDMTIQQLGLGCAIGSSYCEDGGAWGEGLSYASAYLGGISGGMALIGANATIATAGAATANPVGLSWWVTTAAIGL